MLQIPYETIVEAIVVKTGKEKSTVESEVQAKLAEFSGLISLEGAAHIIANEQGVDLIEESKKPILISQLKPGMKQTSLVVKVLQKYDVNTFERNGQPGKVQSMLVGDTSGKSRLTFWHEDVARCDDLDADDIIMITGVSTRENQGRIDITAHGSSEITKNPEGITIDVPEGGMSSAAVEDAPVKKISDIVPNDVASLLGPIVQVMTPYFYVVETGSTRRVKEEPFDPEKHEYNYVLNVVLDDGSESMRIAFFNDQVLDLVGASAEDFVKVQSEPELFENYKNGILGKIVKITGRVSKNDQFDRIEMRASNIDVNPDPKKEMERFDN